MSGVCDGASKGTSCLLVETWGSVRSIYATVEGVTIAIWCRGCSQVSCKACPVWIRSRACRRLRSSPAVGQFGDTISISGGCDGALVETLVVDAGHVARLFLRGLQRDLEGSGEATGQVIDGGDEVDFSDCWQVDVQVSCDSTVANGVELF